MDLEIRGISDIHNAKVAIIDITESLQEIVDLQGTNSIATVAIGRVTIANALLGMSQKNNEKTNSYINGNGFLGNIISEYQDHAVRSYVQIPDFDIEKLEDGEISTLSQAVGKSGFLQVTRENELSEPYSSRVQLVNGEINIDYMYYLNQSEQVHSIIASTIKQSPEGKVLKAAGIVIQLLPGHTDEDIDFLEEKLGSLEHLVDVLEKSTNYVSLLEDIFEDVKILSQEKVRFECTCSQDKVLQSVKLLGLEELDQVIEKAQALEVSCDFCKKKYEVSIDDVQKLKSEIQSES